MVSGAAISFKRRVRTPQYKVTSARRRALEVCPLRLRARRRPARPYSTPCLWRFTVIGARADPFHASASAQALPIGTSRPMLGSMTLRSVEFLAPNVPIHILQASEPGPSALIQAGIHGDEIAGVHALAELLEADLSPRRGRLLVCPVMNPPAYRARQRAAPGGLDLNRCFPGDAEHERYEPRLAKSFMDFIAREKPALMATLHESHKRYDPEVTPSFGQTLVYGVDPMPEIVGRSIDALNKRWPDPAHAWAAQYYPVATSSTEVIVDAMGCVGICVETWMGFSEEQRIAMQKSVVEILLTDLGVL